MKIISILAGILLFVGCDQKPDIAQVGGYSFLLRVQEHENDEGTMVPITKEHVDQAIFVIERRLEHMGTAKPLITRQGNEVIIVQIPGVELDNAERISAMLEKVAKIELRAVSSRTDEPGPDGRKLAQRVHDEDEIVPGYRVFIQKNKDEDGNESAHPILLNRRIALNGSDIAHAAPSPHQPDVVDITLNRAGTDKMIDLTNKMRPGRDRIAIVLDGEVISAPVITQTPLGKHFAISGLGKPGEVKSLANALMNPLENPLKVEEMRRIEPTSK